MENIGVHNGAHGAEAFGFRDLKRVHWNLEAPALYEHALRRGEACLVRGGALLAETGRPYRPLAEGQVRGPRLRHGSAGLVGQQRRASPRAPSSSSWPTSWPMPRARSCSPRTCTAAPIRPPGAGRVFTELAWHSLFIRNLLIRPDRAELPGFVPDLTIVDLPSFKADPARHGCRSETIIACDFTRKIVLIGGTSYAGEMKKSVFTYLNYVLPPQRRHADALLGQCRRRRGDVAVFFGLSGTGKTTLSADPNRTPPRRRRARLGALRRVQLRGRLLRQDDPALGARPSPRSTPRPSASARSWRTSSSIR